MTYFKSNECCIIWKFETLGKQIIQWLQSGKFKFEISSWNIINQLPYFDLTLSLNLGYVDNHFKGMKILRFHMHKQGSCKLRGSIQIPVPPKSDIICKIH